MACDGVERWWGSGVLVCSIYSTRSKTWEVAVGNGERERGGNGHGGPALGVFPGPGGGGPCLRSKGWLAMLVCGGKQGRDKVCMVCGLELLGHALKFFLVGPTLGQTHVGPPLTSTLVIQNV